MKKILFFLLALLACGVAGAQIITTVAGDTTGGPFNGDSVSATSSNLYHPTNVAVDGYGNFYIADTDNNRIRKVNAAGIITTIAGTGFGGYSGDGGPATAAKIFGPLGMAFDASGNLYFADDYNNRVRKISTDGTITTIAGTDSAGYNGDHIPATSARLYSPHHITFDAAGNLYICDMLNHRIRRVNTAGVIITVAGTGVGGYSGDDSAALTAEIDYPYGIAIDGSGNIFFSDYEKNRIRKIDPSGTITTVAGSGFPFYGGDNGPAALADIHAPAGITIDNADNIYFADVYNNRIRKINHDNEIISTIAGNGVSGFSGDGGPAVNAEFRYPLSITIDLSGNFYIADFTNDLIRCIKNALSADIINDPVSAISIFPNPCNGQFNIAIKTASKKEAIVTITDGTGRQIEAIKGATNTNIPIAIKVPAGTYYLTINVGVNSCTSKIIIE